MALRLPTRVSTVAYLFRFRSPRGPPSFVLASALPVDRRALPGQDLWLYRPSLAPVCSHVDASGISQVFRRSFPCLCCVPRPRSNRLALATDGHVDAAPAAWTAKASAMADFGANPQLRHSLPYASRVVLPHTCKACFRLAGSAFAGRESNPLDRCEWFQLVLTIIRPSCSPDATNLRSVLYLFPLPHPLPSPFPGVSRRIFRFPPPRGGGAPRQRAGAAAPAACRSAARQLRLQRETRASRRSTVAILGRGPRFWSPALPPDP